MIGRPQPDEYASYYGKYISLVHEDDVLATLETQMVQIRALVRCVSAERETFRYGPDKWSIREVVGHLIDGERVFGYRAFCFSRGETAPLPSFDENAYVANSPYDQVPLTELVEEFAAIRTANLIVMRRLDASHWSLAGVASGNRMSVRALAHVMIGHVRHHLAILESRYGVTVGA